MDKMIEDLIKSLETTKKALDIAANESEDVKDGTSTAEEEKAEPIYQIWNNIVDQCIGILKMPASQEVFKLLSEKIGGDASKALLEFITMTMVQSTHNTFMYYDELMWNSLNGQFKSIVDYINNDRAALKAHDAVLKVHKKTINEIAEKLKLSDIKTDTK